MTKKTKKQENTVKLNTLSNPQLISSQENISN